MMTRTTNALDVEEEATWKRRPAMNVQGAEEEATWKRRPAMNAQGVE